jgi:hypothetical protein
VERRAGLLKQLGERAYAQLQSLAESPTPETAATLNSIWIVSLFPATLNGLLRDAPELGDEIRAALRALGTVRRPPRVDNRDLFRFCPFDTLAERAGER